LPILGRREHRGRLEYTGMTQPRSQRDNALEALRGIAAVSVLCWHSMLGFLPERAGIFPEFDPSLSINRQVWFGLVYGSSSVSFFFVLSGFVLTRHLFTTGDPSQIHRNAIKRLPRLAFPVLITVLLSYSAFRFGLYSYQPASTLTRSSWLYYFGNASVTPIVPGLFDALKQGSYRTFFRGDAHYDSSLWTMRYEFIGSFVAFGLALIVQPIERRALRLYMLLVVTALCHYIDAAYVAFPLGVGLAAFLPSQRIAIPGWATVALVLAYVYLSGFAGQLQGAFRPFALISRLHVPPPYVNMLGAALLLVASETSPRLRSLLSGRWGTMLGRLSFPLYLVHVPVLCSVGCAVFLAVAARYGAPRALVSGIAATAVASFAVAYPLTRVNEWWVAQLNRIVARAAPKQSSRAAVLPVKEAPVVSPVQGS
jgi:peptidoglycan/LPS O-acetylase OafA/YrhL